MPLFTRLLLACAILCTTSTHATPPPWLSALPTAQLQPLAPVPLSFNTHHPQGMTIIGDTLYLSSVQSIDRAKGLGHGYLFEVSMQGELLRTLDLGEGAAYHPSGLDFDGKSIWVAVAEYRPDSSSIIYKVNPKTMTATEVFRFPDHIGGLISVPSRRELIGVSWGSRKIYRWKVNAKGKVKNPSRPEKITNGQYFIDYQDGQWIRGTDYILFGGLNGYRGAKKNGAEAARVTLGGMALVDTKTMQVESAFPISLYSKKGRVMNQNPFYVQKTHNTVKLYFIPDDNESLLYHYTVEP